MKDVLIDTLLDGVKMLPFLLAAYLIIEYMEHRAGDKLEAMLAGSGKYGPLGGALLGALPQCGFSVVAANFYAGRVITRGTLIAVFLSTSDEAIPVMLSAPGNGRMLGWLIAVKVVVAVIAGMVIDLIDRRRGRTNISAEHHHDICSHCGCEEGGILRAALHHTAVIFVFILAVSLLLNSVFYLLGEETVGRLLLTNSPLQPLLTAIFGFIPNCAASVVLTQLYLAGGISFGSVVAGLSTGAGIGTAVLFQINRNWRENLRIVGLIYLIGAGAGMLMQVLAL
ncbi:putative manganese transporter [Bacilliculturomica massiliensis]|uniref:putative manganese transporter n=1 Tax=Bacilliculturomica massiliensis TaxID=1917867 RepID=UPI001FE678B0|nr:putative manganese transporter [Bacilliculturomica massiliensis]